MSMLPVGIGSAEAGGYQIERSLRFNFSDSAHLNRTPASATNRTTWTYSYWFKSMMLKPGVNDYWAFSAFNDGNNYTAIRHHTEYYIDVLSFNAGSAVSNVKTQKVFRDPSAWNHMVIVFDTGNATQSDRVRIYHNGIRADIRSGATYPGSGSPTGWVNSTSVHYIGRISTEYFDGYLTEINFIDGQALDPTSFGETDTDTGVWKPKAYTGSYGTNGFYLNFSDNSGVTSTTLGKDSSGNGNNWTPNNFSVTAGAGNDSLVDTPTNYGTDTGVGGEVRGNYCTMNPLQYSSTYATLSNGNLNVSGASSADAGGAFATARVNSGKWYWEVLILGTQSSYPFLGFAVNATGTNFVGGARIGTAGTPEIVSPESFITLNGSPSGTSFTTNDVIQFALDMDNGKMWVGKNGTWMNSGVPASGTGNMFSISDKSQFVSPYIFSYNASSVAFNFGQRAFSYTAPSGFKALCTQNLPEPVIKDGGDYFNAVTYTGPILSTAPSGTTGAVTGVGFSPDFVWIKARSTANSNLLFDRVRGINTSGAGFLITNSTDAQSTVNTNGGLYSLDADGFTVVAGTDTGGRSNNTGSSDRTYVSWNWKANGAGSTNTAGTITSTVSVNTTSGFSIVTYTGNGTGGATIGHGLGVAPSMIIIKRRSSVDSWLVYSASLGATNYLVLNTTDASGTSSAAWNNTSPTSSVFSVGTSSAVNGSSETYVAYCFAPVAGYSAFGSYTGNGSADGTFVYTGFRPRFVMVKRSSAAGDPWQINDTARNPSNLANLALHPNASDAEATYGSAVMDILSNGFKLRGSDAYVNASGSTYIYMAFAESPFRYSLAR